jgi:uncharacterized damage-inducible protein DinB
MEVKDIRLLYDFNGWANRRMLECVSNLSSAEFLQDQRSSYRSIRDTLVHMLGAEWIWLQRWMGISPKALLDPAEFPDVGSVSRRWSDVENGRAEYLKNLKEESLPVVVTYVNTRGETWKYPLGHMLVHLVNHSTYHRGQIMTMVRQLGKAAVETDFLEYFDRA